MEAVCAEETRRQWESLILIPSESICLPEARAVLASTFSHVYAEGRPDIPLLHDARGTAGEPEVLRAWRRRLADGRYYKGTAEADVIELVAQRFIAQAWAALPGSPPAEDITVVVQALSGAAANLAVETALLEHGDVLMGLDLAHGGHLTHGSEFNFSGRSYRAVSYGIDPESRRLDYDDIRRLARRHRPRLIIGGASSYPYDFDWAALRAIADEVGAYLLADVAHLAGMIVAGLLRNPLAHAHVVTFTTHKTLLGPRGAVILTGDRELGQHLTQAVFPGLQGGPHLQSIAAIARLFEVITGRREEFVRMQKAILENTAHLAECLREEGFRLEYGGTDTHMLLVDLKPFPVRGEPGVRLDGEIASRMLELVGIVVNKNVLPGDATAGQASGLRMGMPWLTQRGIMREQVRELARIIKRVLSEVRTLSVWVPAGDAPARLTCRGRIPAEVLAEARQRVRAIVEALPYPPRPESPRKATRGAPTTIAGRRAFLLRGEKVTLALEELLTCRVAGVAELGRPVRGFLLCGDGAVLDDVLVAPVEKQGREERWLLLADEARAEEVREWIGELSDGYILFDPEDLQTKVDGPTVIEEAPRNLVRSSARRAAESAPAFAVADAVEAFRQHPELFDFTKPYFVGQRALWRQLTSEERAELQAAKPPERLEASELPGREGVRAEPPPRRTVLYDVHRELLGKMTRFAGWEMPVEYPAGLLAEHRAVRTAAALFDVSHMSLFEVAGPDALAFLEVAVTNCVSRLDPGEAQYTCILDPEGVALDDLFLYRLEPGGSASLDRLAPGSGGHPRCEVSCESDRFLIVSNAANAERVWDWLVTLQAGRAVIDPELPVKRIAHRVALTNLRGCPSGDGCGTSSLLNLAFQGPASLRVLAALCRDAEDGRRLGRLRPNHIMSLTLAGIPVLAARTGYTGERVGFELYVHPARARELWFAVLEKGKPEGVLPAGLGARDSTRTEAGLPLFGHELEGDWRLTPTEVGYGFVVRYHVPFFVGRRAYMARAHDRRRHLLRLRGKGRKTVRPGHTVLDGARRPVGAVTSFSFVTPDFDFIVLAWVEEGFAPRPGTEVQAARLAYSSSPVPADSLGAKREEKPAIPPEALVPLTVLSRFPTEEERITWAQRYR